MNMTPTRLTPGRGADWFEAFYARHYRDVYAFCYRRASHAAEDLTAEVFSTIWRRRQDVPEPALPWTFGVAHNVLKNEQKRSGRRARLARKMAAQPVECHTDPGLRAVHQVDHSTAAADILGALSTADSDVLKLWAWEELDTAGIAAVLNISPAAARARLSRARKRAAKVAAQQHVNVTTLYSA